MSETKTATPESTTTKAATRSPKGKRSKQAPMAVPWVEGGIDYGPALVAVDELIAWAFDLAASSVADCPEGKRRVKNARRYLTTAIRGKRARAPEEDLVFTVPLLIRIFDGDLGLGLGDIVTVLSELGLPTSDVPHAPRATARAAQPVQSASTPRQASELAGLLYALRHGAAPAPVVPAPVVPLRRPPPVVRGAMSPTCGGCCLAFARAA